MENLATGTVIGGRYELVELAGEGGMASVWRATDRILQRSVAVKILHPHLAKNPNALERFRAEALAEARLTHPNIVRVFDTGTEDGLTYIVIELLEGETLRDVLARQGPLDPSQAVAIMLQVLTALQFAHDAGVIHRDVKPANVLVGSDGRVKVADFGIAKAAYLGNEPTTTGQVLGSVPYMSPEQVEGKEIDARSDVYSCGAVLYQLLTGRLPFAAPTELAAAMLRLTKDPVPPRAIRAGIPRPLDAVVMRAMARHPEQRFASAEAMAASLSRLGLVAAPTARVKRQVEPEGHAGAGVFRSWMLVPLLLVLLAAAAIVIGLLAGRLELGGPLGVRAKPETPSTQGTGAPPTGRALHVTGVQAFDPFGDRQEHDDLAQDAVDGDPQTFWETENYNQLSLAPKPGVGLLFDLGGSQTVTGFRLQTPNPGFRFEIRVGDDPTQLQNQPGPAFTAAANMRRSIDSTSGRYVLVWITEVVPTADGNRATIAEFAVYGSGG
ncbi:MAG: protein kinase [Actinomycetota bacterium]|nr:protein kinase [Actinomycetota bacterium]